MDSPNRDIYIGTYINNCEDSVHRANLDMRHNKIAIKERISAGVNPSFLLWNGTKRYLYAVNELSMREQGEHSRIVCLERNNQGEFVKCGESTTKGDYACHMSLSCSERHLFVANYGGTISVYTLSRSGALEELVQTLSFTGSSLNSERQESAHIHATISSRDGKYLFATDLGCDCIYQFDIAEESDTPLALVDTLKVPEGNGPRHAVWDENGEHLYVSCELSSSVCVYSRNQTGLCFLQEVKAFINEPAPYPRTSASEIQYHNGYVYMGNRGDDSISVFKVEKSGTLSFVHNVSSAGRTPRSFKIFETADKNSAVLVVGHMDSSSVAVFSIKNDVLALEEVCESVEKPVYFC